MTKDRSGSKAFGELADERCGRMPGRVRVATRAVDQPRAALPRRVRVVVGGCHLSGRVDEGGRLQVPVDGVGGAGLPPLVGSGVENRTALTGDRATANRLAAEIDTRPGSGLILAVIASDSLCGAPFDLEATPHFKARLAESGLPWPPIQALKLPPRTAASNP